MRSYNERILEILANHNKEETIEFLKDEPELLLYVINVGLDKILATARRNHRRAIKFTIAPEYTVEARAVRFSPDTIKRVHAHSVQFLRDWYIGGIALGDLTKEELLAEAEREKRSGTGHLVNARIYEILAEPLHPGQKMRDHWSEDEAKRAALWASEEPHPPNGL